MSGSGEIIGDIAQGALTARAFEPGHGEHADGHLDGATCANCGAALVGPHCHQCGQAGHVHRTLGAFFHDLLHGVFHFEGKIWRTLPMLAWQPGRLTREYIDGRRASYVSPIALFLFSVFLMFAVIKQFAGAWDPASVVDVDGTNVNQGMPAAVQRLETLKAQRADLVRRHQPTGAIDGQIAGQQQALDVMREVKDARFDQAAVQSDVPVIDHALRQFKANPGLVLYKLQNNAYKYSWALIPLSVPFVWLLFPFSRRFHLYDHTVLVTYSLCAMTLLAVALTLAGTGGVQGIAVAALALPPWHMYRQLRGAYGLSRLGALWRTAALLLIALTALTLFALLVMAQSGA